MPSSNKPDESIDLLVRALSSPENKVHLPSDSVMSFNNAFDVDCFILHEGVALVCRSDTGLVLASISGPFIVGYNQHINVSGKVVIRTVTPVTGELLEASRLLSVVQEKNLWQHLFSASMYSAFILFRLGAMLSEKVMAEKIRLLLNELMEEPAEIRLHTTVVQYLRQRTYLSEKAISKYLTEFNRQHFIRMEGRMLMSVSHEYRTGTAAC